MLHACSFFLIPFWDSTSQTSFFNNHLAPHAYSCIWFIENSRASLLKLGYSEKGPGDLPEHFARIFSLVVQFSQQSERTKLMTCGIGLTDFQITVCSFLQAITFMWSCRNSNGDLISSSSNYFSLCLHTQCESQVYFNCTIIFWSFHLYFLCACLAMPITSNWLFWNLRCVSHMIHPELGKLQPCQCALPARARLVSIIQSFLKASNVHWQSFLKGNDFQTSNHSSKMLAHRFCLFGCQFLKNSMQWTGTGTVTAAADWTVSSYECTTLSRRARTVKAIVFYLGRSWTWNNEGIESSWR